MLHTLFFASFRFRAHANADDTRYSDGQMMDTRAFWISPEGYVMPVELSHISMVIRDPEKFGLTTQDIKAAYRKHNEPVGLEGKAREELIVALLGRGWIRVREYRNYLAVQLLDLGQYDSRHFVTLAM